MECLTCSVKEAAKILGVSQDYIRQMDGKTLPRLTKLKGTIRFALKDDAGLCGRNRGSHPSI